MEQSENINNQSEQELKTNQLLILWNILLNFLKQLYLALHMEKLLRKFKAKDLNAWDNIKHEIIYNKDGLNPRIEHVTNFPKLNVMKNWAEAEKFD